MVNRRGGLAAGTKQSGREKARRESKRKQGEQRVKSGENQRLARGRRELPTEKRTLLCEGGATRVGARVMTST